MRRHELLSACALLALLAGASRASFAGFPDPVNSTIPVFIRLVGADAYGLPDPEGAFTVVFRDLANNPIAGAHVLVDLSAATDLRLCPVQPAGVSLVSGGAEAVTDAAGIAHFTLLGHAIPGASPSGPRPVTFYADGVLLGSAPCAAFDLDGFGGVTGADLSLWLADFMSAANPARSDYDGTGMLGGNDLSLWLRVFTRGTSALSCPSVVAAPN